jgi:CheY-like chemotaxis protein
LEPELKYVDLSRIVREAIAILERIIPKMVRIETRLAEGLKPARGDPHQLEQVLLNLASNAKDAMPDGGVLTIETAPAHLTPANVGAMGDLKPGEYVRLTVSDSGSGMDQAVISHIFDPFFTTKGVGEGTGLGLSTVYGIVKSHCGHVHCASRPGAGASFHVYLPVGEEIAPTVETPESEHRRRPLDGRETVLVVDDEGAIVEAAREALESFGYQVLTAGCGEEALEVYGRECQAVDLVILDLGMPGMGGVNCLKELLRRTASAKVMVASGYSSQEQARVVLDLGAKAFVRKPYRLTDLLGQVREVLDN